MEGRIGGNNCSGEGCYFRIELLHTKQVENTGTDELQGQSKVQFESANIEKILLVEDNLVNCEVAVDMLEAMGIAVDVANNGQHAIDLFVNNQYALILMDCEMPVMDGFTATKLLRKNEYALQRIPIPIIALTAHAISGTKEKCIASGMDDFLSKPFSMSNLHLVLKKWLKIAPLDYSSQQVRRTENASQDSRVNETKIDSPILNYAFLRKLYLKQQRDGSNIVNNIIDIYLDQSSRLLADFTKAIEISDIETVRTIAHTLKSSSANVGALGLSALCREIELNSEPGRFDNSVVQQFYRTFTDVEKALNSVLENVNILQSQ
jgi:CheY-like chemotaxis protein